MCTNPIVPLGNWQKSTGKVKREPIGNLGKQDEGRGSIDEDNNRDGDEVNIKTEAKGEARALQF